MMEQHLKHQFFKMGIFFRKRRLFVAGLFITLSLMIGLFAVALVSEVTLIFSNSDQTLIAYDIFSSDLSHLSPKVLRWKTQVEAEMSKQGLDQKWLAALLGIISCESGGDSEKVPDIFQASESKGLPPNSLNTQQSIQAGVSAFKSSVDQAKANGIDDPLAILFGYNMGSNVFKYMKDHGIKKWDIHFSESYSRNVVFPAVTGLSASMAKEAKYLHPVTNIDGKHYIITNGGNFHYPNLILYELGGEDAVRGGYLPTDIGKGNGNIIGIAQSVMGYWSYSQGNRASVLNHLNPPSRSDQTDCSGFTYWVYKKAGMRVPDYMWATSSMQADIRGSQQYLKRLSENQTQAGDVVVDNRGAGSDHTAILLEKWHGDGTKIIEMGGYGNSGIHQSTYGVSFVNEPTDFARGVPK